VSGVEEEERPPSGVTACQLGVACTSRDPLHFHSLWHPTHPSVIAARRANAAAAAPNTSVPVTPSEPIKPAGPLPDCPNGYYCQQQHNDHNHRTSYNHPTLPPPMCRFGPDCRFLTTPSPPPPNTQLPIHQQQQQQQQNESLLAISKAHLLKYSHPQSSCPMIVNLRPCMLLHDANHMRDYYHPPPLGIVYSETYLFPSPPPIRLFLFLPRT
jgi:hypothetical protein